MNNCTIWDYEFFSIHSHHLIPIRLFGQVKDSSDHGIIETWHIFLVGELSDGLVPPNNVVNIRLHTLLDCEVRSEEKEVEFAVVSWPAKKKMNEFPIISSLERIGECGI